MDNQFNTDFNHMEQVGTLTCPLCHRDVKFIIPNKQHPLWDTEKEVTDLYKYVKCVDKYYYSLMQVLTMYYTELPAYIQHFIKHNEKYHSKLTIT